MRKKLFGLSIVWILVALVILFFVYGIGRREGYITSSGCTNENSNKKLGDICTADDICCTGTCMYKKKKKNYYCSN